MSTFTERRQAQLNREYRAVHGRCSVESMLFFMVGIAVGVVGLAAVYNFTAGA